MGLKTELWRWFGLDNRHEDAWFYGSYEDADNGYKSVLEKHKTDLDDFILTVKFQNIEFGELLKFCNTNNYSSEAPINMLVELYKEQKRLKNVTKETPIRKM